MNTSIYLPKYLSSRHSGIRHTVMLLSSTVLIMSCASAPEAPVGQIQAAEQAIANAERAQVVRYASIELNIARTELTAARAAVGEKNMPQAERLALQSKLSADLAMAKAELLKAQTVNQDMQQSIDALQQEAQRNQSGVRP